MADKIYFTNLWIRQVGNTQTFDIGLDGSTVEALQEGCYGTVTAPMRVTEGRALFSFELPDELLNVMAPWSGTIVHSNELLFNCPTKITEDTILLSLDMDNADALHLL